MPQHLYFLKFQLVLCQLVGGCHIDHIPYLAKNTKN